MAAIQNHKDNLLQAATVRFDATLTEVDWTDVKDNFFLKPQNLATFGAEFDVNLIGRANTHNIVENAVHDKVFVDGSAYTSGETIGLSLVTIPKKGDVFLFYEIEFKSSHSSTSGYSEVVLQVDHEAVTIANKQIIRVPNPGGSQPHEQRLTGLVTHTPIPTIEEYLLVDHNGNYLVTHADANIAVKFVDEVQENYDASATFNATGDGTRGAITYFAVTALVMKR